MIRCTTFLLIISLFLFSCYSDSSEPVQILIDSNQKFTKYSYDHLDRNELEGYILNSNYRYTISQNIPSDLDFGLLEAAKGWLYSNISPKEIITSSHKISGEEMNYGFLYFNVGKEYQIISSNKLVARLYIDFGQTL